MFLPYPIPDGEIKFSHLDTSGRYSTADDTPSLIVEVVDADGVKFTYYYFHFHGSLSRKMRPSVIVYSNLGSDTRPDSVFDKFGTCVGEYWYVNNLLHRENDPIVNNPMPALITMVMQPPSHTVTHGYYRAGKQWRNDFGATELINTISPGEVITAELFHNKGVLNNVCAPAIRVTRNNEIVETAYYIDGVLHCKDAPAHYKKIYVNSGYIELREWRLWGKLHREDAPALINHIGSYYYIRGELHRDDGPAFIHKATETLETFKQLPPWTPVREWYQHGELIKREYAIGVIS